MDVSESCWCVVVAAGRGLRFGGEVPKQYAPIDGRPLLAWTLERLAAHPRIAGLVVGIGIGTVFLRNGYTLGRATKTYPLVLSSALHYAEKILDDTEVCGIYYRELTRENGKVKSVRQYDISTLFTLDGIVDMAAEADLPDKQKFISVMLHPDREV